MDPSHVVPDQLPDESYIERLFPKCPPKHQANRAGGSKETKSQQKRQTRRSKLQHNSRRELEARRDRLVAQSTRGERLSGNSVGDYGNNHASTSNFNNVSKNKSKFNTNSNSSNQINNDNNNNNNNISSDSSVENVARISGKANPNLVQYSDQQQHLQQQPRSPPQPTSQKYQQQQTSSPPTVSTSTKPIKRRVGKYTASQRLLQQLQRSQSTHNVNNLENSLERNNEGHSSSNDKTANRDPLQAETKAVTGIFKSSSSYALPSDSYNSANNLIKNDRRIVFSDRPLIFESQPHVSNGTNAMAQNPQQAQTLESTSLSSLTADLNTRGNILIPERDTSQKVVDFDLKDVTEYGSSSNSNFINSNTEPKEDFISEPAHEIGTKEDDQLSVGKRNDEKFINLYVYDNSAVHETDGSSGERPTNQPQRPQSQQLIFKGGKELGFAEPVSAKRESVPATETVDQLEVKPSSHPLLTNDLIDNSENVVRNDASIEELCSIDDSQTGDTSKIIDNERKTQDVDHVAIREVPQTILNSSSRHSTYRSPLNLGTLQTVDEKAEINLDQKKISDQNSSKIFVESTNLETMPSNPLNRKSFVPPGYPQRIRPQSVAEVSNDISPILSDSNASDHDKPESLSASNKKSTDFEQGRVDDNLKQKSPPIEAPRVRFDESSLWTSKDYETWPKSEIDDRVISRSKGVVKLPDQPCPLSGMNGMEQTGYNFVQEKSECNETKDLTSNLGKINLNDSVISEQRCDSNLRPEPSVANANKLHDNTFQNAVLGSINNVDVIPQSDGLNQFLPNLRHQKLPNETSHYSVVRTEDNQVNNSNFSNSVTPRSSSIQFNTLSDADSDRDERSSSLGPGNNTNIARRCDQISYNNASSTRSVAISASSASRITEVSTPTTKTALIFPRLDEGLSSEAESADDEVEDDEDKAMEADVEADDDDDDDDADVDDDDSSTMNPNSRSHQGGAPAPSSFGRQQTDMKLKDRAPCSASARGQQQLQHLSSMIGVASGNDNTEHSKATAYGGYVNQESADNSDLKSQMNNFQNQNGQSNYWNQPSTSNQQTSSQHFIQRGHNIANNSAIPKTLSFSKEEAKASNRLSSDTDNETDRLLGCQRNDQLNKLSSSNMSTSNTQAVSSFTKQNSNYREVLIEGVLFNVKYLGSTHTDCEGRGEKEDRIHQAEMAVHEVKFRNGDSSPAEVQLFISTEKIMVLDERPVRKKNTTPGVANDLGRPLNRISCHVFESSESHTITKSISQAFQVAYTELLKNNSSGDTSSYLPKELDYQEVLNSQEMSTDELEMFARKENQREVVVPKQKGEILGLSIVESGWGSVLPTVVIANLKQDGPAYKCKKLSVGDQILSVNGISLVGLPLAECQEILRKTKNQSVARLSVVPCPITVEVKIKRPDTKYQLGFSVQNGVICSLLRGGIAERGGVRVGHRIMSINGTTVVGVPHDKIVTLLASSVGEIRMKTCLTSLYRLILGEENPVHF